MPRATKRVFIIFFLILPLVYLFAWRVIPAFQTIYLSLTKYNLIWDKKPHFIGLKNYLDILKDTNFLSSVKLTLVYSVAVVVIEFLLAMCLALILDTAFRAKNVVLGLLLIPMVLPPAVVGIIWYILFNEKIGPIAFFLGKFGMPPIGWLSDTAIALPSVIMVDVWQWTSFLFLLFICSLQTIPDELYDSARVDGTSWLQTIWYIKVPLILRMSIVAMLLRYMDAFREFDKIFVMTGGGPGRATELVTMFIYRSVFRVFDIGYGAAFAVIILLIVIALYIVFFKFGLKRERLSWQVTTTLKNRA